MNLELTSSAQLDAAQAAVTYEIEEPGLGTAFEAELDAVLVRIADGPLHFPVLENDVRRALLKRFPFGVFFVAIPDTISVIAVLHLHRHPDTWRQR